MVVGVGVVGPVGTLVVGVVTAGSSFSPQPDPPTAAVTAIAAAASRLHVRAPHTGVTLVERQEVFFPPLAARG